MDNYLLKPIDNDELIANLRNTVSEIEKEAAANLQIRQGTNLLRSNTLRRLVAGYISQEELREKAEFLHIPLDAAQYLCAVCSTSQQIPADRREQFFRDIIAEKGNARQMAFTDAEGNLALLLAFEDAPADRGAVQQELDALAERAAREHGIPLMIGTGSPADGAGEIRDSYESAREALEYGAFLKNGGVIWSDEVPESSRTEQVSDSVDYELMKEYIRKGEQGALKAYLEEMLNAAAAEAGASHRRIRNLMMHIAVRMTDCFRTIYGSMNTFREPEGFDFARLFALRSYSDMRDWLFQQVFPREARLTPERVRSFAKVAFLEYLANGVSRNYVLWGFTGSNEYIDLCNKFGIVPGSIKLTEPRDQNYGITSFVARCYTKALGRSFDVPGLNTWCKKILEASNKKEEAIKTASDGFFHSAEFKNHNYSNEEYLKRLYRTFLNREPDAEGFNDWLNHMKKGMTRDQVLYGFAYSTEFAKIMAQYGL